MKQQFAIAATATGAQWATNSRLYATASLDRDEPPGRYPYPSAYRRVSFAADHDALTRVAAHLLIDEDCGW